MELDNTPLIIQMIHDLGRDVDRFDALAKLVTRTTRLVICAVALTVVSAVLNFVNLAIRGDSVFDGRYVATEQQERVASGINDLALLTTHCGGDGFLTTFGS